MSELNPKIEKKIKGSLWFKILFVLAMLMLAIATFFKPVWDELMKIVTGQ